MRIKKFLGAVLAIAMILSVTTLAAQAAGNDYSRFNNPGKGHDWSYSNSNDNSNTHHNENGYQNHIPADICY